MLGQFRSGQALGDLHKAVVMRVSRCALAVATKSLEAHGEFILAFGIDRPTTRTPNAQVDLVWSLYNETAMYPIVNPQKVGNRIKDK